MWKRICILAAPVVSMLTTPASAQTVSDDPGQMFQFNGTADIGWMGNSVAGAGDVNRDGFPDLIVGATKGPRGTASVYSGKDGSLLWRFHGIAGGGDGFGVAVAGAGDVDQDGFDDVVVGASGAYAGAGYAEVYSGRDGTELWRFGGLRSADGFGRSVAGAGDINQDGFDDVIIGAPMADPEWRSEAGSAYVYSGKDGALLWQFDGEVGQPASISGDRMGTSVAGAGDVNEDGFPDVIVGAALANARGLFQAGSAYIFSGKDGTEIWQFDGSIERDRLGGSVANAGDVNQDGVPDAIVGWYSCNFSNGRSRNFARVYSGKDGTRLWEFFGNPSDGLGCSVSGAGDVNQDGFADLIVGAPGSVGVPGDNGAAVIYSGKDGTELWKIEATESEQLGWSVTGAGDVNRDGFPDVIFGAIRAEPHGIESAGSAYVYSPGAIPAVGSYGVALAGTDGAEPRIWTGDEPPAIGSLSFEIVVSETFGSALCVFAGSLYRRDEPTTMGVTLYGDYLTPAASAQLVVVTTGAFVPGVGTATLPLTIPNDPNLIGFTTYWQAFVADAGAQSAIGFSHSGGLAVTLIQ